MRCLSFCPRLHFCMHVCDATVTHPKPNINQLRVARTWKTMLCLGINLRRLLQQRVLLISYSGHEHLLQLGKVQWNYSLRVFFCLWRQRKLEKKVSFFSCLCRMNWMNQKSNAKSFHIKQFKIATFKNLNSQSEIKTLIWVAFNRALVSFELSQGISGRRKQCTASSHQSCRDCASEQMPLFLFN